MKNLTAISSSLPPESVKSGQVWRIAQTNILMVWDGETWLAESDLLYRIDFYKWLRDCMDKAQASEEEAPMDPALDSTPAPKETQNGTDTPDA